jgi:hypothetical protein
MSSVQDSNEGIYTGHGTSTAVDPQYPTKDIEAVAADYSYILSDLNRVAFIYVRTKGLYLF